MRPAFAAELVCPVCRGDLALQVAEERTGEVWSGSLRCASCPMTYPVADGIPRLLPEDAAERDAHWEALHRGVDYPALVRELKRRFALPEAVQLDYYAHAALLRRHGTVAGRVLELGAGSGSYSLALHLLAGVRDLCLLDLSASALAGAQRVLAAFGCRADFVQGDIRRLPFRDRAFAMSLSGGLIEHFPGEAQRAVVAEHGRVAERVLVQAPASTAAYWGFRALYTLWRGGWPFGYERPLTRGRLRRLLAGPGFAPEAWGAHDFAASAELLGRLRWRAFPRLHRWPGLARLTRHDWIVLGKRV